jgi:hypothetical protein
MAILKRLKTAVNAWLDRLGKQNKEQFGAGALDCCKLEKKSPAKSQPGR